MTDLFHRDNVTGMIPGTMTCARERAVGPRRINVRAILNNPVLRRELHVQFIMAMQEHEGRDANRAKAEEAYDNVQKK